MQFDQTVQSIRTLAELPVVRAARAPGEAAVVHGSERLDVADLERRSAQVANGLLAMGLAPGTRVAILDRNSAAFLEVLFGVERAGAVLVTVNFRLTPREAGFILSDAGAGIVFVGAEFAHVVEACRAELPGLRHVVLLGDEAASYARWRDAQDAGAPPVVVEPAQGAVQMYTSGTTGNPKGVVLSHQAMVNAARAGLTIWQFLLEPGAAVLGTMPLFHIAACNLCIAALFAGARAEIVRDATAAELAGIIPSRGINLVPLPPVLIHGMLRLPDIRSRDFSALKVMLVAGSGIAEELIREATAVFNCGFALSYGSTETCGGVTYLGPGECVTGAGDRLRSAGQELWESAVRIVHADGSECQPGEVGEILCRSNRLMTGYWKREQATAESLRDGWFHSGDAGFLDAERYLYVVDRIKDMVISGGENIYPAEIEGALFTHPGIEDAAVVGIPDAQWGESLLAFVVPRAGHSPSPAEIEAFLRERLAGYKVPRRYEFVGTLPRNATGKVLKRELRAPYWQGRARRAATSGDSAPS